MDPIIPAAGAVVALLAVSAVFSSSEIPVFSLPSGWAESSTDPRTAKLTELRSDPHRLLVTILVGNNVVNVDISSIITVSLARAYSPAGPR